MTFHVVIPARLAAERLPRKPLRELGGRILVAHACDRARESQALDVLVATDSDEVVAACAALSIDVLLTSPDHNNGTERCAEVAALRGWGPATIVVNVQGDEPLLPPALINAVAAALAASDADVATLACPITSATEYADPNAVKVVVDAKGNALLFSRAPIPANRDNPQSAWRGALRHVGLYAYRVGALRQLAALPACELEARERLEQLRALWHGLKIRVHTVAEAPPAGVDTPADLARVAAVVAARAGGDGE